jgi:hypothetical protein
MNLWFPLTVSTPGHFHVYTKYCHLCSWVLLFMWQRILPLPLPLFCQSIYCILMYLGTYLLCTKIFPLMYLATSICVRRYFHWLFPFMYQGYPLLYLGTSIYVPGCFHLYTLVLPFMYQDYLLMYQGISTYIPGYLHLGTKLFLLMCLGTSIHIPGYFDFCTWVLLPLRGSPSTTQEICAGGLELSACIKSRFVKRYAMVGDTVTDTRVVPSKSTRSVLPDGTML